MENVRAKVVMVIIIVLLAGLPLAWSAQVRAKVPTPAPTISQTLERQYLNEIKLAP